MSQFEVHQCQCAHCQQETSHPDQELHRQMNLLLSRLDEQQRRWYVAVEANRIGVGGRPTAGSNHGSGRKDDPTGTARTGRRACSAPSAACALAWWRSASCRKKDPELEHTPQALVEPETAGDPMSEQKWVRSSLRQLSERLKEVGHAASPPTVSRLLRKLGYSLRVNAKKQEASSAHPDRKLQRAACLEGTFEKGQKVSDEQMQHLNLEHLSVCSQWNYVIRPRPAPLSEATPVLEEPKVIF